MLHRAWRALFAAMFITSFVFVQTATAASCDPGSGSDGVRRFVGQRDVEYSGGHDIDWVAGVLEARFPYVGFNGNSAHWIMLAGPTSIDYIQVGFRHVNLYGLDVKEAFVAYDDDGPLPQRNIQIEGNPTSGGFHSMSIQAAPSDPGYSLFSVSYVRSDNSVYYETFRLHFKTSEAEAFGETNSSEQQMAGSVSSHAQFNSLGIRDFQTQTWSDFNTNDVEFNNITANDNTNWYGRTRPTDSEMDIWDKRCP